jgi:endonuclease YncB( thermonuclease family)
LRGTTLITTAAFALLASAAPACDSLTFAPGGVVVEVTDGDTVVLNDGRKVRLIGTQAPKLPLGREDFVAWPLATEAQQALSELMLNKTVRLGFGGEEIDRHERVLAHVFVETVAGEIWAPHFPQFWPVLERRLHRCDRGARLAAFRERRIRPIGA